MMRVCARSAAAQSVGFEWDCGFLRLMLVAVAALGVVCAGGDRACGAELPREPMLAYGDSYTSAGQDVSHRGVDIGMESGSPVGSLVAGRVHFAGTVPSPSGGTMNAVTIEDAQGRLWSFLPLESATVALGVGVDEGECLGYLASAGDASSDAPHLHVGLRVDGEYQDPVPVLEVIGESGAEAESSGTQGVVAADEIASAAVNSAPAQAPLAADAQMADVPSVEGDARTASPGTELRVPATGESVASPIDAERTVRDDLGRIRPEAGQATMRSSAQAPRDAIGMTAALGFVTLLGIAVGVVRATQESASRRVYSDLGSTRLQPR